MSQALASALFKRDLSEAEMDALEASLERDPAVAERLFSEAEAQYRATGLPEPRWDERQEPRGRGWILAGALLLGGGMAALALRPAPHRVCVVSVDDQDLPVVSAPRQLAGDATAAPRPAHAGPAPAPVHDQGRRLGVVLRLDQDTPVRVEVRDGQGALVRQLFNGILSAGQPRVEWDGLDARGRPAAPGDYQILVIGPHRTQTRPLRLKAAR
jgi:hypothetical protein